MRFTPARAIIGLPSFMVTSVCRRPLPLSLHALAEAQLSTYRLAVHETQSICARPPCSTSKLIVPRSSAYNAS